MKGRNINHILSEVRGKTRTGEDQLLSETRRILTNDLLSYKKILQNLGHYKNISEVLEEEEVNSENIYTLAEIREMAIHHRLKFLDSKFYKPEIPYEAVLGIKHLNNHFHKELQHFKVLTDNSSFRSSNDKTRAALFIKTNHDNYYLLHEWGQPLPMSRKLISWPLRSFEAMAVTVIFFTLLITLLLPTNLITLDHKATYWCGYRMGTFFHLLIFFSGFTAYFTITFARNFSNAIWNRRNDLD